MKLAYRAENVTEAEIVRGLLEANGLTAHTGGFYLQGGVGEMATTDFAHVHVPDEEYERARELIAEYEQERPPAPAGSTTTGNSRNALVSKLLLGIIAVIFAVMLFYALRGV